jgi:Papain family cysteine protease
VNCEEFTSTSITLHVFVFQAQKSCRFNPKISDVQISGYVELDGGSELKLQGALSKVGPISVSIDASHRSFRFYNSGWLKKIKLKQSQKKKNLQNA